MDGVILVAVIVIGIVAVVVGLVVWRIWKRTQTNVEYINTRLQIRGANFFGQQSKGMMQMRGNGIFTLTGDTIYFDMWIPANHFEIPLSKITGIETPRSFLGKTVLYPLLQINFQNDAGEADAIAWWLRDVESVKGAVEAAKAEQR